MMPFTVGSGCRLWLDEAGTRVSPLLWLGIPTCHRRLGVRELGVSRRGAVEENWLRGLSSKSWAQQG